MNKTGFKFIHRSLSGTVQDDFAPAFGPLAEFENQPFPGGLSAGSGSAEQLSIMQRQT